MEANSAVVRFCSSVDGLRPTFRPEALIQGVIPDGGIAPNVVADRNNSGQQGMKKLDLCPTTYPELE